MFSGGPPLVAAEYNTGETGAGDLSGLRAMPPFTIEPKTIIFMRMHQSDSNDIYRPKTFYQTGSRKLFVGKRYKLAGGWPPATALARAGCVIIHLLAPGFTSLARVRRAWEGEGPS